MVLTILLSNILLPIPYALAADGIKTTLDISYGNIVIGNNTLVGYSATGTPVATADSDGYIITGSTDTYTITVTDGSHNIILNGLSIDVNATASACAFFIQTGAAVNLSLSGTNELISGTNCAGLQVPSGASVTISGSGSLSAQGGTYGAGVGGGRGQNGGSITISGGTVTANGGSRGAGIGGGGNTDGNYNNSTGSGGTGGSGGNCGEITISGGTVEANGGERGAGIGGGGGGSGGGSAYGAGGAGGAGGSSSIITISDGKVEANGGERGAGIGGGGGADGGYGNYNDGGNGGAAGSGGIITISTAEITATGNYSGAGIGSGGYGGGGGTSSSIRSGGERGSGSAGGVITISNAKVKAQGGNYSAGIGGGAAGSGGEITITGSTVDDARSSLYGAGIGGGGINGSGGTIIIISSDVTAGSINGAGIGGGSGGSGGSITISGGQISAASTAGAGIGGGSDGGNGGFITFDSVTVTAQSQNGAGIGGGSGGGSGGTITVTGSDLTAESINGAGIGGGSGGSSGEINIGGGRITAASTAGAGIGGGNSGGSGDIITIESSDVTAQSQTGAGIGGGAGGSGGEININGGRIAATSTAGAGIGGGSNGGNGDAITINSCDVTAESQTGAGIGGGSGSGNGGTIAINSGDVTANSIYGAGIGGGAGNNGGNGGGGTMAGWGGAGGSGGSGGEITISGGQITATSTVGAGIGGGSGGNAGNGGNGTTAGSGGSGGNGGSGGSITISGGRITATSSVSAGIGGGSAGRGGNGGSGTSGGNGGSGGSGGSGGTITISGGIVTVPGENYVKIDGSSGGSGGAGGSNYSSGAGGNGGSGGSGGDVIITGGTILPSGSGTNNGIGGAKGENGGNGGGGSGGPATRPSGSAGAAGTLSSCVVTGGNVNANIGCIPTTGGETPVNVYYTVVRLGGASNASVTELTLLKGAETIPYGINDMYTDANGWLYVYLPAYEESITTAITAGGTSYGGYNGLIRSTATYSTPNVIKISQTPPLTYINPASKEFNFGETVSFTPEETAVSGGLLTDGTVTYSYSGIERGTDVIVTNSPAAPVNAGSYTLNATLPGNDYYHDAVAVKNFVIHPKSIAGFTVESIGDQTYSGAALTPAVTVRDGSTTLLSGRDYSVSYSGNKNVGTATATITGQNNYSGTLTQTFEIKPKEIALNLSALPDATMVGSDVVLTATASGAVNLPAGTVTFKYGDTVIAENVPFIDDGSYRATVTWSSVPAGEYDLTAAYNAAASDNYTCVSNGLITDFSILKYNQNDYAFADGTDYAIVDGVVHKTYGDSVFTLRTVDKLSTGDETFTVISGSDVVTIDENTGSVTLLRSGTAVISVLSPSDANYNEASATLTISVAKAAQSGFGFADSALSKTYGDAPFTVTAAGGQSTGGVTYTVTAGDDVASVDADSGEVTIHKSGTAVITATRATDDRYLTTTAQITITVARAVQSGFGFAGSQIVKTYGDASFTVTATGGQSRGAVTYKVTSGRGVVSVNSATGLVAIQNAGTAVITATRAGDDRYNAATQKITIIVDKAPTVVTALPLAADIDVVGRLSASALSGGAGSVPGHFSWADPDQIVSMSGKYQAVFTPEDIGNYLPSTCDVQVNVKLVLVHSPTGIQFDLSQASVPSGVTSVNVSLAQIESNDGNVSMDAIADLVNADKKFSGTVIAVYDLELIDQSGQSISGFTGPITVRIPVPDGMSGDLRVFWFDTDTNTMTDMNARLEDGWLVFETTHFSYYTIVQMTALSPPATVTTTGADAGANILLIAVLILAGVAVAGGLAVYLSIRKRRKA